MHRSEDKPGAEMTCFFSPSCVSNGRPDGMRLWVRHNRIFNYHMSALHCACRRGQTETALELIDLGADISAKDDNGNTPLHLACYNGHTDTVLALIARGADVSAKDVLGQTPLHYACLNAYTDTVLALIDCGADIDAKDKCGNTPLLFSCVKVRVETTQALIDRGADIFRKNIFGQTFANVSPDVRPRVYERLHVSTVRSYTIHL